MPAHDDDLLRAEPPGGDDPAKADRAVAHDGDGAALADPGGHRGMMAGPHYVGQGQQRGHEHILLADRERVEGAVRLRDSKRLGLSPADIGRTEEAAVDAGGLEAFLAEQAASVGIGERHHHHLPSPDRADLASDILDDSDRLVAHRPPARSFREVVIRPQVAPADAGPGDPDQSVGRFPDRRIGDGLDPDVVGLVHDRCAHLIDPFVAMTALVRGASRKR